MFKPNEIAALLALLSVACVSETLPAVDEGGRSLWQRVETEHFVVESNVASESEVRETASDFETLWHAFASVPVLGRQPPGEKPIVVLFDSESEYRYFAGQPSGGMFFADTLLGPLILLPPHSGPFQDITVKHELAHFVSSEFLPDAPMWLSEGLAQVMETASYDSEEGQILFGDFLRGRVDAAAATLPSAFFMGEFALRCVLQAYAPNPARERSQKNEDAQRDLEAASRLDPRNARVERIRAAVAD